ncbi:hypothetical protein [Tenacibaculum sp. Bg11-29]|uniref:hypothetical protein n=1 Tax=Tenacibaculum sp. Bg11-29 TaxID=2058306 RepID=UPI001E3CD452|nr:hypothetical protein [Tenacibaculum sp. Bg11-29]
MMEMYGDIGIIANGTTVVKFNKKDSANQVTKVSVKTPDAEKNIALWGKKNNFPQQLLAAVKRNCPTTSGLQVVRDAHYGGGFVLMKETFEEDKNNEEKRKLTQVSLRKYPEIYKFFRTNQMPRFYKESITDLEYFAIAFPEYVLSNDKNKIELVRRQKSAHCRFEEMKDDGTIGNVWLSTKWADSVDLSSKYSKDIPLIDSYMPAEKVKEYCKKNKITNFIRPLFYPMLDESYYPIASWHSAYYSKWIDIANSIPEFKKALFKNQSTINKHIEIHDKYFEKKYAEDWEDYSVEEKDEIRQEFANFLNENLSGNENSQKTVFSMMYDQDGKQVSGLKITTIDDKLKEGAFLPDGTAATLEIIAALTVDPTLIGLGTASLGGGSDKREAWTILTARQKPKRETTLESFQFIQDYNGWDADLIGAFEDTILTSLDKNPTGSKKAVNV